MFEFKGRSYYVADILKRGKAICKDHPKYKFILVPEAAYPDCLQCHFNYHLSLLKPKNF